MTDDHLVCFFNLFFIFSLRKVSRRQLCLILSTHFQSFCPLLIPTAAFTHLDEALLYLPFPLRFYLSAPMRHVSWGGVSCWIPLFAAVFVQYSLLWLYIKGPNGRTYKASQGEEDQRKSPTRTTCWNVALERDTIYRAAKQLYNFYNFVRTVINATCF